MATFFRSRTRLFLTSGLILMIGAFAGYAWYQSAKRPANRPPESQLPAARSTDGEWVTRSVLHCPAGDVLVEHYPKQFAPMLEIPSPIAGEFAEMHFREGDPWYEGFNRGEVLLTFNCGAFALAPYVGLTPRDYVDAIPKDGFQNPFKVILQSYFVLVGSYTFPEVLRDLSFEINPRLNEGDIVCFLQTAGGREQFVHAGRLHKLGDRNMVLSKCGRGGPILLTDVGYLRRLYPSSQLNVFRFQDDQIDDDQLIVAPTPGSPYDR